MDSSDYYDSFHPLMMDIVVIPWSFEIEYTQ